MANPEHLEILKQGVKEWDERRRAHPEIAPDFSDAYLIRTNLSGANVDEAFAGYTIFIDIDPREVKGLESVEHLAPSEMRVKIIDSMKLRIVTLLVCAFVFIATAQAQSGVKSEQAALALTPEQQLTQALSVAREEGL